MFRKEKPVSRIYKLVIAGIVFAFCYFVYSYNSYQDLKRIRLQNEKRISFLKSNPHLLSDPDGFISILNKFCDPVIIEQSTQCLEMLSKYKPERKDCSNDLVYYHTFWQLKLARLNQFNIRVLELNLMSYLATQNLKCTKFILWKLAEFPQNIEKYLNKKYEYYIKSGVIEIRTFDFNVLCSNDKSSFYKHEICKEKPSLASEYLVALSDFVRFFVLDLYGGIYVDGDLIFLRDMQPLWDLNFSYRWSFVDKFNTAVLGINKKKNSQIKQFYDETLTKSTNLETLIKNFHPNKISETVKKLNNGNVFDYEPLRMLNGFLFDPAWLCFDQKLNRFNSKSVCYFAEFTHKKFMQESDFKPDEFFSGAFTYHLHLKRSSGRIYKHSYFYYFEKYYNSVLKLNA